MYSPSEKNPPNGGYTAWSKAVGCFLIYFNTLGLTASFGVYQTYYQTTGLGTPSMVSWIGTIQAFLLFFVSILSGPLFDRGYGQYLFYLGCLFIVLGTFMLSLATEYYQIILTQCICVGLGSGMLWIPTMSFIAARFGPAQRALAIGIITSGSSIGMKLFPLNYLSDPS